MKRRFWLIAIVLMLALSMSLMLLVACDGGSKKDKGDEDEGESEEKVDITEGIDVKDPEEVMNKLTKIINDCNYTVEAVHDTTYGTESRHESVKMDVTESIVLYTYTSGTGEEQYGSKLTFEKLSKGVKVYELSGQDDKWHYTVEEDGDFSIYMADVKGTLVVGTMTDVALEYNNETKMLEGTATVDRSQATVTIKMSKDSIVITVVLDSDGFKVEVTETYTNVGTTEVSAPKDAVEDTAVVE